jgi:hypothetical protein
MRCLRRRTDHRAKPSYPVRHMIRQVRQAARYGFDAVGERQKHARAGPSDRVRALVTRFGELNVFGFSFDMT